MAESVMLIAALALIARGWPVFPCVPGGKRPLARCVPNGFHGATTDVELVTRWWTAFPFANVAIPTGPATVDVFDVDVKPAGTGFPAFNRLKAAGLLPAPLAIYETPSGGLHCHYPGTSQACASLKVHFIDFKALGGYVLVPPSVVDGRAYRLISEPDPSAGQLNWSAVRSFLDPPKPVPPPSKPSARGTGIPGLAAWLATKTKPGRNGSLFWAACRATENGAAEGELHELYARMQFGAGFDERQAARTVADAYRITTRRSA
ncbi:bifunctional DNA primase/polymerase [Sphaerisporangium sp. NPDC051017]|uniref:bifunctional DNA primase/polymerase n=1 Tax=Sphaerisporangium sp. NPDC051017 TaxID=3154636 RepID=UPI00342013E6